jgi:phosphohistidine phosphatase
MDLYLLRHAIAVERGTPGFEVDRLRTLTPAGAQKMRQIAQGMRKLDLSFDLILTSPYLRAHQTAAIVADTFHMTDKLATALNLEPDGDPRALIAELNSDYRACRRVLLVGHEPCLSELIAMLTTGGTGLTVIMKKGGLCQLTLDALCYGQCAILEWVLTPRQLILMA